jgi:hypothetical protein
MGFKRLSGIGGFVAPKPVAQFGATRQPSSNQIDQVAKNRRFIDAQLLDLFGYFRMRQW